MRSPSSFILATCCALASLLASGTAASSAVLHLDGVTRLADTGAPSVGWSYELALRQTPAAGGAASLVNGAHFTLYGFAGFVPGSCSGPEGWQCAARLETDTDIADLTWTYVATTALDAGAQGLKLGAFSAASNRAGTASLVWNASAVPDRRSDPLAADLADALATGPGGAKVRVMDVPEPSALALAVLGLGLIARQRRQHR